MVFLQHCSHSEQHCFRSGQTVFMFFEHSKLLSLVLNSIYSSHTELLFHRLSCILSPLLYKCPVSVFSITIIYFILGVRSGSLTFLVPMSANCRPPSHQSILLILHFYPFLTKCILLEMCLVCLVSLPFLAMHIADLLSKTIKGNSSGTMSGSLFNNS